MRMLKHLFRYIKPKKDYKLVYRAGNADLHLSSGLIVYADASLEEKTSRVGLLTFVHGNLVSWQSHKQNRVATSTSESEILEYIINLADKLGFGDLVSRPANVFNDNLSEKCSTETGGKHDRNKAYKNRINRIIRAVEDFNVEISYVNTKSMLADGLTQAISDETTKTHSKMIGLYKI